MTSSVPMRRTALSQHLQDTDVRPSFYAVRWFLAAFAQDFALPDLLRLWDALLAEVPSDARDPPREVVPPAIRLLVDVRPPAFSKLSGLSARTDRYGHRRLPSRSTHRSLLPRLPSHHPVCTSDNECRRSPHFRLHRSSTASSSRIRTRNHVLLLSL